MIDSSMGGGELGRLALVPPQMHEAQKPRPGNVHPLFFCSIAARTRTKEGRRAQIDFSLDECTLRQPLSPVCAPRSLAAGAGLEKRWCR